MLPVVMIIVSLLTERAWLKLVETFSLSLSLSLSLSPSPSSHSAALRVHEEPIAFLPADSSLYDFTLNEKQCPVCQHIFVTLTEKEFQSHVALCLK